MTIAEPRVFKPTMTTMINIIRRTKLAVEVDTNPIRPLGFLAQHVATDDPTRPLMGAARSQKHSGHEGIVMHAYIQKIINA